ncbi:hypothetical protein FHR84_000704 [Actinopolyspora biskrensis]|uniref:Uncharacterized protein n=1 Tax=Actinopolyspora biskrensis TaxID=1470178 RepID=A0A852YTG6_9ACTN|nr:DUF5708 family protein [Actinopolyspora biskrensis]NYH77390.1 hypothetical protein [Actinopolyspora biskrensis]
MSANVKSLFIGAVLLIAGLVLAFTARGVRLPVVAPDKVGVVLAVLGGIELVVTAGVMLLPPRSGDLGRE